MVQHLRIAALVSVFAAGSTFAATATRAPYVEDVRPDSAVIGVRLSSACPVTVRFGTDPQSLAQTAQSAQSATQQFVTLTGLQPGTSYTYQVDACGTPLNQGGTFVSAPPVGSRNVHFAAMGDFGTGGPEEKAVADKMLQEHPAFWLALGDDAYESGTESDWDNHFFAPLKSLLANVPVFPALGNHEYVTNDGQPYLDAFQLPTNNDQQSERYYSFDWGDVHVSVLDSMCAIGNSTSDCNNTAQKAWLTQDLAQSKATWKVAIFHHPVYSTGEHGSTPQMQAYTPIFEAGGVDLVLTGHDHTYERTKPMVGGQAVAEGTPGAVTYIVVGTGGAGSYQFSGGMPSYDAVRNTGFFGYLDLNAIGGTLTGKLVTSDGQTKDTFTLNKSVPAPTVKIVTESAQGQAPLTAHFIAQTEPADATINWSFSDGGTATGTSVDHTFADPGTYTVTATATSGDQTGTATASVTVDANQPPVIGDQQPSQPGTVNPGADTGSDSGSNGGSTEATAQGCNAGAAAGPIAALAGLALMTLRRRRRARK